MWNASASAPVGLYRLVSDTRPRLGELVAIMPPTATARMMAERHYRLPLRCAVWLGDTRVFVHTSDLHREIELANAMSALGIKDFRFLAQGIKTYRDSGMMETEPNNRPDVFWQADLEEAADYLVAVIEEVKPHILITYDEIGGYGHPDHIQAHRVAMRASEKSQWQIQKIYWNTIPKSVIAESMEKLKEIGSDFFGTENIDEIAFAKADEFIDALIDGNSYVEQKMAAMKAHHTQIALDGPFFALSNNLGLQVWGNEFYTLAKGEKAAPFDEAGRETDLFAGIIA